jgi:hypothetical protein
MLVGCLSHVRLAFCRDRHGAILTVCLAPRTRGADKTDTQDSVSDAHEPFRDHPVFP